MLQFVRMARVMMTARRIEEGDAGASAQGASTPVTRSASKKKISSKEKTPSKRLIHLKKRPTVDSHLLFGASTVTNRDF